MYVLQTTKHKAGILSAVNSYNSDFYNLTMVVVKGEVEDDDTDLSPARNKAPHLLGN